MSTTPEGDRIAKVMARAGLCSRREAEAWIAEGRVKVNGQKITSPALNVTERDDIRVDGKPLPDKEKIRLWRYHKPRGLLTTARDPQGRPTVFEKLPKELPRVVSVGRLDLNSEGLLLLTNDGELARRLELPPPAGCGAIASASTAGSRSRISTNCARASPSKASATVRCRRASTGSRATMPG
jgi:23S rRNA pseudouridine2605 synthase